MASFVRVQRPASRNIRSAPSAVGGARVWENVLRFYGCQANGM